MVPPPSRDAKGVKGEGVGTPPLQPIMGSSLPSTIWNVLCGKLTTESRFNSTIGWLGAPGPLDKLS